MVESDFVDNIVREIKRKSEVEKKEIQRRVTESIEEVEILRTAFLKIDKDMKKMILFGSLAEDNVQSIHFDIDLAVRSKKYYQLVARALDSKFKVDVIDLDTIHQKIKERIFKNGKVIYGKREG